MTLLALELLTTPAGLAGAAGAAPRATCQRAAIEAELEAGKPYLADLGDHLRLYFQPIASGWILRVEPDAGPWLDPDFAELATPPYDSVSPLSLSTDFAFRAQDAVGWNPRRFRFAASAQAFSALHAAYEAYRSAAGAERRGAEIRLMHTVLEQPEALLTIRDARLILGTADQSRMAEPVAQQFETTAHTLVTPAPGAATPQGRLLALRVRVDFDLPKGFRPAPAVHVTAEPCSGASL